MHLVNTVDTKLNLVIYRQRNQTCHVKTEGELNMFFINLAPGSPGTTPGGSSTLGRPVSLPVSKQQRQLSSSNPDLAISNPGSPDTEIAGLIGKTLC